MPGKDKKKLSELDQLLEDIKELQKDVVIPSTSKNNVTGQGTDLRGLPPVSDEDLMKPGYIPDYATLKYFEEQTQANEPDLSWLNEKSDKPGELYFPTGQESTKRTKERTSKKQYEEDQQGYIEDIVSSTNVQSELPTKKKSEKLFDDAINSGNIRLEDVAGFIDELKNDIQDMERIPVDQTVEGIKSIKESGVVGNKRIPDYEKFVKGISDLSNATMTGVSEPFMQGDVLLRKGVPYVGEPVADIVAFPFEAISEATGELTNFGFKVARDIGVNPTPETEESLSMLAQGLAQFLVPAGFGKVMFGPKKLGSSHWYKYNEAGEKYIKDIREKIQSIPPEQRTADNIKNAVEESAKIIDRAPEEIKVQPEEVKINETETIKTPEEQKPVEVTNENVKEPVKPVIPEDIIKNEVTEVKPETKLEDSIDQTQDITPPVKEVLPDKTVKEAVIEAEKEVIKDKQAQPDTKITALKDIFTDEERFQPRNKLNENKINDIIENFDERELDPITIWKDPADNKYYVLSGHHRLEAMRRMGKDFIPTREYIGTEAEAKYSAQKSNSKSNPLALIESASVLRKLRESGLKEADIKRESKSRYDKNSATIYNLSHLNEKGPVIHLLEQLEGAKEENSARVRTLADWIGKAREQYPELTNAHETEMFDYLMNEKNLTAIKTQTNFVQRVGNIVETLDFDKSKPLNLKNKISYSPAEIEFNRRVEELQNEKRQYMKQRSEMETRLKEQGLIDNEIKNHPAIQDVTLKIKGVEKDIKTLHESKKGYREESLFGKSSTGSGPMPRSVSAEIKLEPVIKTDFKGSDLNDVLTLRSIGRELSENLNFIPGQSVRVGLIKRFSRRALGIFFPDSTIVRLRNLNDVDTMTHEFGHWLDRSIFDVEGKVGFGQYGKAEGVVVRALGIKNEAKRQKLIATYEKKYGVDLVNAIRERYELRKELKNILEKVDYPQSARNTAEGIAEFTRLYVMDQSIAINVAPKFYSFFEKLLAANENLRDSFLNARKQVMEFKQQDPRQLVESTIARNTEEDGFLNGIKKTVDPKSIYYNILDATAPFRELAERLEKKYPNLPGKENPLYQVLSIIGADGKAKQFLENRPFRKVQNDIVFLKDVKPLFEIIDGPLKDGTFKQFEGYLVSLRNLELARRDVADAMTVAPEVSLKTKELYERDYPHFPQMARDLYKYQDAVLQYYTDSGKISHSVKQGMNELNKFYVPFQRYFAEFESTGKAPSVSRFIKDSSPNPVKKIKGSTREVVSPIGSVIKNTYELILAADKNTALNTIVNSLKRLDKTLVQEIPSKVMKPVLVRNDLGNVELRFTTTIEKPKNYDIITTWQNGEMSFYQVPKEFYDGFFAINEPVSKAIQTLSLPSRILQAGAVVYDPTFAARNIARDQVTSMFYTKYGYNPTTDFAKGLLEAYGKKDSYQKFLASGADQSFLTAMDRIMSESKILEHASDKLNNNWQRYKSNPLEVFQDINRASELGTRVGSFKKAYMKTGDVYKAMLEAREIAADYGVRGKAMTNVSPLYPFLNARLQHLKRSIDVIKKHPGRVTAKGLMFITAPAVINWLINNMDEDNRKLYQELPEWRRYSMFNIKIPGTQSFLPVPKGFWGVLFGTGAEGVLDWLVKNEPETVTEIAGQLIQEISPLSGWTDIVPQFGRPIVEQWANKKGFTGKPIVPQALETLEPGEQYTEYTPEIIKKLGGWLNISPLRIEALITAYTAGFGRNVLTVGDEILQALGLVDKKPEDLFTKLSKFPVLKAFITEPPLGTRGESVAKFYEKLDELEELNKTVNNFIKQGDDNGLNEYLKKRDYDYMYYVANQTEINKFKNVLRAANDMLAEIKQSEDLLKDEKIAKLQLAITTTAQEFQKTYKSGSTFKIDGVLNDILIKSKSGDREDKQEMKKFKNEYKGKFNNQPYIPGITN